MTTIIISKFPVSMTVRDDQECEEAAVNNAKDIIKATSKEIVELSEGKSSLQASTTVLEVRKKTVSPILLILPFFCYLFDRNIICYCCCDVYDIS
jgi:hypothetical protein